MTAEKYVCPDCCETVEIAAKPKRTFMGFQRIPCPSCQSEFRYPLTTGYVVFYWVLLIGNLAWIVSLLSQGKMVVPNPIGIVVLCFVVASLVKNTGLKRKIAELQQAASDEQ